MEMVVRGRVWKYGDDVNTDVIFPGKYTYTIEDEAEMARHALEDLDPSFAQAVQPGDVVVGGKNWGTGSSREQAVTCLRRAGVRVVIARSFARIYYRNAMNGGLLAIVCPEAVDALQSGDTVTIDLAARTIEARDRRVQFPPISDSVLRMIEAGGLIPMLRRQLEAERASRGESASSGAA